MLAYITKRLLSLIPVLAVVTIAIFLIIHITPGNPAAAILGMEASQEEIEQLNQDLGLDRPILEQYTSWVANVFKGDLGRVLGRAVPSLQDATMVPFRTSGPFEKTQTKPDLELFAKEFTGQLKPEELIGGGLEELLKGIERDKRDEDK